MRRQSLRTITNIVAAAMMVLTTLSPTWALAEEAPTPLAEYQLEVSINSQPSGLVSRFTDLGGGHFASPASELRELGIKVPAHIRDDELLALDDFDGLVYVYDEPKQSIDLVTVDGNRITTLYDARGQGEHSKVTSASYGAVLNYSAFGTAGGKTTTDLAGHSNFEGVNVSLDGRLMAPAGVFSQTAILGSNLAGETNALRLESTYTYTDEDGLTIWRAGDMITGGLGWTRSVRLGGVQAQRSFTIRPDLVTTPLPAISGSAAVPSSVDVYVNGVKSYTKEVAAGPFQIDNIPSISGAGVAQVVTRDAAGRESLQTLSFYTSPQLLRPGLYDFSAEVGLPRQSFGVESFEYDDKIASSATLRAGITDWLTLESHGEAGAGVWNGGGGAVLQAFNLGIVSAAASASTSRRGEGFQLYGSFATRLGNIGINARTQHTFDDYEDLASRITNDATIVTSFGVPVIAATRRSQAPPRAVDSVTVSSPLTFDKGSISATFLQYTPADAKTTQLLTATYSRPLISNASMYATGFMDLKNTQSSGLYVGVNVPLDGGISVNAGVSGTSDNVSYSADASKAVTQEEGSFGWRIRDLEGSDSYRSAAAGYRSSVARVEAGVRQDRSGVRTTAEVEGAVALLGGDIYVSNRIDDAFAVVDAHAPGVSVQRENITIGKTGDNGKILIPSLNAYQDNKIAIDPLDLPIDAEINSTVTRVKPSFRSGVYVEFDVKKAKPSAIVILKDANGKFLTAGSEGRLEGSDEPFIVGYDGQAFIKDLSPINTVHVNADGHECSALFTFGGDHSVQPTVGPEVCE